MDLEIDCMRLKDLVVQKERSDATAASIAALLAYRATLADKLRALVEHPVLSPFDPFGGTMRQRSGTPEEPEPARSLDELRQLRAWTAEIMLEQN